MRRPRAAAVVTSSNFDVEKGEEAPQLGDCFDSAGKLLEGGGGGSLGDCGPVTGIARKDCNWKMNYHVEGKQQSPMEIVVMKDGKELKLGKDVNAQVTGDSINLSVINSIQNYLMRSPHIHAFKERKP